MTEEAIHPNLFPPAIPETKSRKRRAKPKKAKKMSNTKKTAAAEAVTAAATPAKKAALKTLSKKTATQADHMKKIDTAAKQFTKAKSKPVVAKKVAAKPAKKVAAKKVAAKKVAAKPAAPAHRIDYKAGARVKVQRKNGEFKGFVTQVITKKTGSFIEVNIGTKQVPILHQARPAQVKGF